MRFRSAFSKGRLSAVAVAVALWIMLTGADFAAGQSQADSRLYDASPLPYLLGVYTVTWVAFFAYAFYMTRRQRELRRQIEEIRWTLEERKA